MNAQKNGSRALFCMALVLVYWLPLTPSQAKIRPKSDGSKPVEDKYRHWPIAELNAPAAHDAGQRQMREAKSQRYNLPGEMPLTQIASDEHERLNSRHWWISLPALPAEQSDIVVLGKITQARAYLSGDKTNVYSEFTVQPDEFFKGGEAAPSQALIAEREGGRVRLLSGTIFRHEIRYQGLPRVGRKYVLFLKRVANAPDYEIITGFEINGGRVAALDGVGSDARMFPFRKFDGYADHDFIRAVREAVKSPVSIEVPAEETPPARRDSGGGTAAVQSCAPAPHDAPKYSWKEGSAIRVYVLQNNFTSSERTWIQDILSNKFEARAGNPPLPNSPPFSCSDVRFQFFFVNNFPAADKNHLRIQATDLGPLTDTTEHLGDANLHPLSNNKHLKWANIRINSQIPDDDYSRFWNAVSHEVAHTFGLLDCVDCGDAQLNPPIWSIMDLNFLNTRSSFPTDCDQIAIRMSKPYVCGSNRYTSDWAEQTTPVDFATYPIGGAPNDLTTPDAAWCGPATLLLIDLANDGFSLSDASNGVFFDVGGDGVEEPVAWTLANDDDAWLVYDRNGDGSIDYGTELFSNFTPQAAATNRSGFLALAEFDKVDNGGNNDGKISGSDDIFTSLYVWRDVNHNGLSESGELHSLTSKNVTELSFTSQNWGVSDQYGNVFHRKVTVTGSGGQSITLANVTIRINAQ